LDIVDIARFIESEVTFKSEDSDWAKLPELSGTALLPLLNIAHNNVECL